MNALKDGCGVSKNECCGAHLVVCLQRAGLQNEIEEDSARYTAFRKCILKNQKKIKKIITVSCA